MFYLLLQLNIWNTREKALCDGGETATTLCGCLHTRPLACLPDPVGAFLGKIPKESADWKRIAGESARTVPGRENGGNCDIKNLSRGCKIYFPVFVEGANLSLGDMHFSQGDGEVSFCGAIEMSGQTPSPMPVLSLCLVLQIDLLKYRKRSLAVE